MAESLKGRPTVKNIKYLFICLFVYLSILFKSIFACKYV